jgi:hypothetical protein
VGRFRVPGDRRLRRFRALERRLGDGRIRNVVGYRRNRGSVNQLAVEVLARSVGQPVQRRNLRGIPGRWTKKDAADFDGFMSEHRRIDDELWK